MRNVIVAALVLTLSACDSITGGDPWTVSGIGNDVIDRPGGVERIRITGSYMGEYQNFIVECGTFENDDWQLLVNEILGTRSESTTYAGTALIEDDCNPIIVENSTGVSWTFTQVR